jgi:hypothetical protein
MYMILAAQFESFVHPITILPALPLTLCSAVVSLILLQTNPNIYAMSAFMPFTVKKNGSSDRLHNVPRRRDRPAQGDPGGQQHAAPPDPRDHRDAKYRGHDDLTALAAAPARPASQEPPQDPRRPDAPPLLTLLVTPVAYLLWE